MNAMSDGGRIGFDAPYQTRECGMSTFHLSFDSLLDDFRISCI